jgi:hypothetical protein
MWLLTTRGFCSVVQDTTDPSGDTLLVRGRVREDLEALAALAAGDPEVLETPGHDYRFRLRLSREGFAGLAADLAREVDYPNFKDAVAERQGAARARRYGEVWATLLGLQRER